MTTFLHTADWQVGRQFASLAGIDADAAAHLRQQRIRTVRRIAELASERQVDFVLVAGDVFEDNAVSDETLRRCLHALEAYAGPWVLLPGNHDYAAGESVWSRLQRKGLLPDNVIVATEPEAIELCDGRVLVLPAPLKRRHETRDLTKWFDRQESPSGVVRIGLAHGSVTGRLPQDAEALNPVAEDRARRARLDYLALGDWHGTLEVAPRTWYAGTPEPDRFRGNDPGNVLLVGLEAPGAPPSVERIPVGHYHWARLEHRLDSAEDIALLQDALARQAGREPERLLVDLRLEGDIELAARAELDDTLADWSARLHLLRVDDAALRARPTREDIASLQVAGYVSAALEELQSLADTADEATRQDAERALRILFREYQDTSARGACRT